MIDEKRWEQFEWRGPQKLSVRLLKPDGELVLVGESRLGPVGSIRIDESSLDFLIEALTRARELLDQ